MRSATSSKLGPIVGAVTLGVVGAIQPAVARAACTLGRLAELPVTMVGLRPLVPATVNGTETTFIADSGAFYSLISPPEAAALHLPLRPTNFNFHLSGVGGDTSASITTVKSFKLAKADIPNIEFLVGGGDVGAGAAGVVGQNVLGLADVEYDLEHGAIRLMRPRGCERAVLAYWAGARPYSEVKLGWGDPRSTFTYVTVSVNGQPVRAILDSGAALSGVSLSAARRAGIRIDGPGVVPAGVSRGIGRSSVRTSIAPVKSFGIGEEEIKNTHLRIADLQLGDDKEMLLGADFLLSHRVYVANSQHRLYFTYDGGPVFNLEAVSTQAQAAAQAPQTGATALAAPLGGAVDTPADADGYARRGAARASRREFAAALADYDHAAALAPGRADLLYRRALVRGDLGQPFLAMADLDASLKLEPANTQAHLVRAELRLRGHDREGALSDLDAVAAAAPAQADLRFQLGELYGAADALRPAVSQFDLWIASHADDSRLGLALGQRCWARALSGEELDRASGDCRRAVRLAPDAPVSHGALGVVELRRGDFARAAADFTLALKAAPRGAWWLYGRGVAELRQGEAAEGRADLAAAAAIAPRLSERARQLGLGPPEAPSTSGTPSTAPSAGRG